MPILYIRHAYSDDLNFSESPSLTDGQYSTTLSFVMSPQEFELVDDKRQRGPQIRFNWFMSFKPKRCANAASLCRHN